MGHSKPVVIAVSAILGPLPTVAVLLRFWARRLVRIRPGTDDWLIVGALLFNYGVAAMMIMMAKVGGLGQRQPPDHKGRSIAHHTILNNKEARATGSHITALSSSMSFLIGNFVIELFSLACLGLSKLSVLFFYHRIFTVTKLRQLTNVVIGLVFLWTLGFELSTIFQCTPIRAAWDVTEGNKGARCIQSVNWPNSLAISDGITDIMILLLPLPVLLRLKMPLKPKIYVIAMFFVGGGVVVLSLARLIVYIQVGRGLRNHWNERTYYLTPVFIWTLAECALAVISACLPTLRPILSRGSATTASHNQTHHPHTSSIRLVQMEESTGKEYNKVEDGKREDNDSVEIGSLTTT